MTSKTATFALKTLPQGPTRVGMAWQRNFSVVFIFLFNFQGAHVMSCALEHATVEEERNKAAINIESYVFCEL